MDIHICAGIEISGKMLNKLVDLVASMGEIDETQAGIKIAGRNINNLRYADDTTLMSENKEDLWCLLMNMKEECEKVGLKLNIEKN